MVVGFLVAAADPSPLRDSLLHGDQPSTRQPPSCITVIAARLAATRAALPELGSPEGGSVPDQSTHSPPRSD
jgi:hypothetical protein